MLRTLRLQVQQAMADLPVRRKPALRRSDDPEVLLATDFPLTAEEAVTEEFIRRLTECGWRVRMVRNWLYLDADVPVPEAKFPACLQGEWGCCLSLLRRHGGDDAPQEAIRAIVKAAEAGTLERACAQLHREWAAALRVHQPLPGGLMPYICRAVQDIQKEAEA